MKTQNVFQAHANLPLRQRPSGKTERVLERVKKLTHELQEIQGELYRELSDEDGAAFRKDSNPAASATAGNLTQFKAAADEIRRVLWLYLGSLSESNGPGKGKVNPGDCPQAGQRLQLLTPAIEQPATAMEAGSFFDRLNLAIEGYMQHRGMAAGGKRTKS